MRVANRLDRIKVRVFPDSVNGTLLTRFDLVNQPLWYGVANDSHAESFWGANVGEADLNDPS